MDVAAYIRELLCQERFVYVPGLGTFAKRKTTVVYHEVQERFYPPKNSIDFIEEEKQDDALGNYISKQKNISKEAAAYFINKFVNDLKSDLLNKNTSVKEALFPSGKETSAESKMFNTVFNEENFGLPPVQISTLKQKPVFTAKEPITKENVIEGFPNGFSINLLEEKEKIKAKKKYQFLGFYFPVTSYLFVGFYALYLYYPDLFSRFKQAQPAAIIAQKPAADTFRQKTISKNVPEKDTAKANVILDTPVLSSQNTVQKPIAKDSVIIETTDLDLVKKSPYEIIGATFKTLKGAKKFLNQLKSKGMRVKILENTRGPLKLITFGSFQDKTSAKAALEKLRARDIHSDAHIQHYK